MRVFVTGATGFVGSHLVDALLARGDEVVCLVRDARKLTRLFPDRGPAALIGSLQDEAALRAGCADADVVYHAAGLTAARSRAEFFAVNADATEGVLRAAAAAAPQLRRFVYVSSLAAAGPARPGRPASETDPPRPVSAYGESKLAGERAVRAGATPWTIVRPPAIYGPRDREFARVFRLARWHLAPVVGPRDQELSLVHIADLVRALLAVLTPDTAAQTYFAAHPEVVTQTEFLRRIHDAALTALGRSGRRDPMMVRIPAWATRVLFAAAGATARASGRTTLLSPDKVHEVLAPAWTCSPAALERDTGWRAEVPLTRGLEETARWYREADWL